MSVIGNSPYSPKPYRTGAFVLTSGGWTYTARPELYRKNEEDQQRWPFWQTPDHMRPEPDPATWRRVKTDS